MAKAAEPSLLPLAEPLTKARPLRVLPTPDPLERAARDELVGRLAADRLRELRDDGVTTAYVARMYGVDLGLLERVAADLLPRRR